MGDKPGADHCADEERKGNRQKEQGTDHPRGQPWMVKVAFWLPDSDLPVKSM